MLSNKCKLNRPSESFFLINQFCSLSIASDIKFLSKHILCAFISGRLFSRSYFNENLNSSHDIRNRVSFGNAIFLVVLSLSKKNLLCQCIIYLCIFSLYKYYRVERKYKGAYEILN